MKNNRIIVGLSPVSVIAFGIYAGSMLSLGGMDGLFIILGVVWAIISAVTDKGYGFGPELKGHWGKWLVGAVVVGVMVSAFRPAAMVFLSLGLAGALVGIVNLIVNNVKNQNSVGSF